MDKTTKEELIVQVQEQAMDLCSKLISTMQRESAAHTRADTVCFVAVKTLYEYVRSTMVSVYGEEAVRKQENALTVILPSTGWRE